MKKIISLLCLLAMVLPLCACGTSSIAPAETAQAETKTAAEKAPKKEVEVDVEPVVEAVSDDIPEDVKVAIIAAISAYYMSSGAKAKNEFTVRKIKKI